MQTRLANITLTITITPEPRPAAMLARPSLCKHPLSIPNHPNMQHAITMLIFYTIPLKVISNLVSYNTLYMILYDGCREGRCTMDSGHGVTCNRDNHTQANPGADLWRLVIVMLT